MGPPLWRSVSMTRRPAGPQAIPIPYGRTDQARDLLETLESVARIRYVPPAAFALVHAGFGDREAVFEWLDKAAAVKDVHLMFLPVDSKWDEYRGDSRFDAVLSRCGFTSARTNGSV